LDGGFVARVFTAGNNSRMVTEPPRRIDFMDVRIGVFVPHESFMKKLN
jgi:hypothetical protein